MITFISPNGTEYGFLILSAGDGSRQVYSYLTSYKHRGKFWGCDNARMPENMPFGSGWMSESAGREKLFQWAKDNGYQMVQPLADGQ